MWRGAIQFGLVTIPVKLYLATETGGIGFNLLHESCLNRIQMKVYCPYHDEVIPRSETVRGYEWSKGKYVVVTDEDIDSVPLKTMRAIEIEMFIPATREAEGTQFVKQAYYLEPEQIGAKAFYLLKSVLADEGKSAICTSSQTEHSSATSLHETPPRSRQSVQASSLSASALSSTRSSQRSAQS